MSNRNDFSRQLDRAEMDLSRARSTLPTLQVKLSNRIGYDSRVQKELTKLKAMVLSGLPVEYNIKMTERDIVQNNQEMSQIRFDIAKAEKAIAMAEIERAQMLAILPEFGGYIEPPPSPCWSGLD
jgi:hypothetical protein